MIIPVSKKAITAVGIDEEHVYTARFKDGLLLIGDLLEGVTDNSFECGEDIAYETGFREGYVEGYREGVDAVIWKKGYRQMHFHDCGLDCDFDCAHCRFRGQ